MFFMVSINRKKESSYGCVCNKRFSSPWWYQVCGVTAANWKKHSQLYKVKEYRIAIQNTVGSNFVKNQPLNTVVASKHGQEKYFQ